MENKHDINISTRDRVFLAWQSCMTAVRDFEYYASQIDNDNEAASTLREFAKNECFQASRLNELLHKFENK